MLWSVPDALQQQWGFPASRQNRTSSNPEQIQAMFFSNGPPVQVVTLVHYKMWAESSVWLPAIELENEVLGVENLPALECVGPTGQCASKKRENASWDADQRTEGSFHQIIKKSV